MEIKDIGTLEGPIVVFGGAYSNYPALMHFKEMLDDLDISPSNIINTGDVVGYCAEPEACVQLIKEWGILSIAGNVEIKLRERETDCGCEFTPGGKCDNYSKNWYPFAQVNTSEQSLLWMDTLPDHILFQYGKYKVRVVHGSFGKTAEFIFKSTPWERKLSDLNKADADIILAGHSGLPFSECIDDKYWINSGVIGMPANDGTTRVWYAILDLDEKGTLIVSHKSFDYDHETTKRLMIENHLPTGYAETLSTGIWDNCEILPNDETKHQGMPIML